ncbi:MAG: TonB-dependent receptor [Bacteroidales bacterium]|nr:TonB-dependent receptor [Bacteroidales bacterium]
MRKNVLIAILSVILFPLASLQAQKYYVVKGQIYDVSDKMTLPQAQVAVVGASGLGAVADIDGNYTLAVDKPEFELNFRYLGYQDKKVKVQFSKGEEVKVLNVGLDTRAQEMQEVKIRGSRVERDGKNSVQSIEMVSIDQIAKNNVTTLDKALKNVAGLAIVDNEPQMRGGSGFSSGMGSRVMLLLDNMPMLRADAGRPTWNLISMDDVEQIDVLKGAASVLYGSAAINGAINVHTKFASNEPNSVVKLYCGIYAKPKSIPLNEYYEERNPEPPFNLQQFSRKVTDKSWSKGLPMKSGISLSHTRKMAKWWDFSAGLDYAYDVGYRFNGK